MEKYVVFAEKNNKRGTRGDASPGRIHRILGYFDNMATQKIIEEKIVWAEIWKESDIDLWFREDSELKRILAEMEHPERYLVLRAGVLDEQKLGEFTSDIEEGYGLQSRIYPPNNLNK